MFINVLIGKWDQYDGLMYPQPKGTLQSWWYYVTTSKQGKDEEQSQKVTAKKALLQHLPSLSEFYNSKALGVSGMEVLHKVKHIVGCVRGRLFTEDMKTEDQEQLKEVTWGECIPL